MVVQKINTDIDTPYELAFKYFSILSILNDMNLVKRDVQLIAYSIEQKAPISNIKKDFVEIFGSSMATVGNIISKLYGLKILIKNKRTINVNPTLLFDFKKDLGLAITFKHIGDHGNKR